MLLFCVFNVSAIPTDIKAYVILSLDDYTKYGYDLERVVDPVFYERNVICEGNLPLVFKFNQFSKSEFIKEDFITLEKLGFSLDTEVFVLVEESYQRQDPVYNSVPYSYPGVNGSFLEGDTTTITYKGVNDYRYVWKSLNNVKNILQVKEKDVIIVNIKGNWKASTDVKSVDIVPTLNIGEFTRKYSQYAWWDTNWSYMVPIIVESDYIATPLLNLPVQVTVNATISALSDGGNSIRFLDSTNTSEYWHEIEGTWNVTGENICWVSVSLASSVDTVFYMYYNNSAASSTSNPSKTFSHGYDAVWHLGDPDGECYDSAGDSPDGFVNETSVTGTPVQNIGKIGNGTYFAADYFTFDNLLNIGYPNYADGGPFTLTGWIQGSAAGSTQGVFSNYCEMGAEQGIRFYLWESSNRDFYQYLKTPLTNPTRDLSANQMDDWNYFTITYSDVTDDITSSINRSTYVLTINNEMTNMSRYHLTHASFHAGPAIGSDIAASTKAFTGNLDEIRLSIGIERNDSWLDAEFNTTQASDFTTFGLTESAPVTTLLSDITVDNSTFNISMNVTVYHPSWDITCYWQSNYSGVWTTYTTITDSGNIWFNVTLLADTHYWWRVVTNDSETSNVNFSVKVATLSDLYNAVVAGGETVPVELSSSLMLFLLWVFLVYALLKVSRNYISIALILGLCQIILVGLVFTQGLYTDIINMWLVAAFGFMMLGFYKTFKGVGKKEKGA